MRRNSNVPIRDGWEEKIKLQGLVYSPTMLPNGTVMQYWKEGAVYDITMADVEAMEEAAKAVFAMLDFAGEWILDNPRYMYKMGIPKFAQAMVAKSWRDQIDGQEFGSVYGRFDFRFGGVNHPDESMRTPKLYEYNADTPTCLVESAWVQWQWLQDTAHGPDQWNLMQELLIEAWKRNLGLIEQRLGHKPVIYFSYTEDEYSGEDAMNTYYIQDCCAQAGYDTRNLYVEEIMLGDDGLFYTGDGKEHIEVIFKLYPWEFMMEQRFAKAIVKDQLREEPVTTVQGNQTLGTIWIEPPYKMLWSNKGILPILWDLFGNKKSKHYDAEKAKYLLPTWFAGEEPKGLKTYVKKPLLGREGACVKIVKDGEVLEEYAGNYGKEGYVVQAFAPLPAFSTDDSDQPVHPVMGVWMIDGEPAGLAIREATTLVTDNVSSFVPHCIIDSPYRKVPLEPTFGNDDTFDTYREVPPVEAPQPAPPTFASYLSAREGAQIRAAASAEFTIQYSQPPKPTTPPTKE